MFQLTAPLREPTHRFCQYHGRLYVSTHGSLAGADAVNDVETVCDYVSTHGSLAGADY